MEGLLRTGDAVQEQSAEWWATEEGKTKLKTYNTINLDRIHLKIAESNVVKRCAHSCCCFCASPARGSGLPAVFRAICLRDPA